MVHKETGGIRWRARVGARGSGLWGCGAVGLGSDRDDRLLILLPSTRSFLGITEKTQSEARCAIRWVCGINDGFFACIDSVGNPG